MNERLLFLCDHSAGKSLLGATYFRAAAARAGLDVEIDTAGPDPDDENMPNVVAALKAQGHEIVYVPSKVTAEDIEQADRVINVGCSLDDLPVAGATTPITFWDVPMLSQDFDESVRAIHGLAQQLAAELAAD